MPTRLREKKREVIATAFVDAAEAAFGARGYDRTTMAEIARTAGCAAGTLYLYFKSKEELFNAMVTKHAGAIAAAKRSAIENAPNPLEGLRRALVTVTEYFTAHRAFFRVFYTAEPGARASPQTSLREKALAEYLETKRLEIATAKRAQKLGQLRTDVPAEELIEFLHGFGMAKFSRWATAEDPPSAAEQAALLWKLSLGGMTGSIASGGASTRARRSKGDA